MNNVLDTSTLEDEKRFGSEENRSDFLGADKPRHVAEIRIVESRLDYQIGLKADITVQVTCSEACDLSGGTILVGGSNDQVLAERTLRYFDSVTNVNTTGSFSIQIPNEPGEHRLAVIFFPRANELADTDHAITQTEFCIKAAPHSTGMVMWRDEYMPVPVGNEYQLRVGVNCNDGCSLLGQKVNVYQDDVYITTVELLEPIAPRRAFYQNQITLTAPSEVGSYTLVCRFEPEGLELSHESKSSQYVLTTTVRPQCRLELSAVNADTGAPVDYVDFYVQPKGGNTGLARSDGNGKASMAVPWGEHHISVIREDYQGVMSDITIPEGTEVFEHTSALIYQPAPAFPFKPLN